MTVTSASARPITTSASRHRITWPMVRHGVEMVLAMAVGMLAIGAARGVVGLDIAFAEHPGGSYTLMATDMAVAMAAWMRIRGHARVPTLQMCGAMYLPLVLLPFVWVGVLSPLAFMMLAHTLMVVAMLGVLFRHQHRPTLH